MTPTPDHVAPVGHETPLAYLIKLFVSIASAIWANFSAQQGAAVLSMILSALLITDHIYKRWIKPRRKGYEDTQPHERP